jgi:Ca-activated chloride channel family protein
MRNSIVGILFLTLLFAVSSGTQAQSQEPEYEVLRVSTNLVTVPVSVKARHGGYIPNLRASHFRIYENQVEQNISHFETIDEPFTVVLMLDVSDSTKKELIDIQNAALAFLNQLRSNDRALIVAFDKQVNKLTEPTSDREVLADAVHRVKTGGGTALYDAVDKVINGYLSTISGRKAVVILTDGIDTSSVHSSYNSTIASASEQYAMIYPIQWDTPSFLTKQPTSAGDSAMASVAYTTPNGEPLRKAYDRGTQYLESIAVDSGGRLQFAQSLKNLERSFAQIADELRQQYTLSYYPNNQASKPGKRRIKVTVNVPDSRVHAREYYVYDPASR